VYEARLLAGDDATLATYQVNKGMDLLDLTDINETEVTPHESIELIMFALTNSRYSHANLQIISKQAFQRGLKGIKYRSFYSQVQATDTYSFVIFGVPLADGLLDLQSINHINLRNIHIEYDLGFTSADYLLNDEAS
jgi:hypothetical protein